MATVEPPPRILIAIHDPILLKDFVEEMYITELRETARDAGLDIRGGLIAGEVGAFVALMTHAPPSVLGCKNGGLSLFTMLKEPPSDSGGLGAASGSSRRDIFLGRATSRDSNFFMLHTSDDRKYVIVIYNNSDNEMAGVKKKITDKETEINSAISETPTDLSNIFPKKSPSGATRAVPGLSSGPSLLDPRKTVADTGATESRKYIKMSGGAKKSSKKSSKKASKRRSKKASKKMSGGAKKKSKKASKRRSKKASKKMSGGAKKKSKNASKRRSKKTSKK